MAAKRRVRPAGEDPDKELARLAEDLDLTAIRDKLAELLGEAQDQGLSYTDFALRMFRLELAAREERRLDRNLRRSHLAGAPEGLDDFDFSTRPKLEARVVRELLNCAWAEAANGRNIICVGRPGLGKTRVLRALGRAALKAGYSVLSVITAEMLEDLQGSIADGSFRRTLRRYTKPDVLILDEFGYAAFDARATGFLFRLVSKRHEARQPLLLAANTGFKSWKSFFPSEAQAVATVDRLVDRATILRFTGASLRKPHDEHGADLDD
jgi:DNA replication protein DnaC